MSEKVIKDIEDEDEEYNNLENSSEDLFSGTYNKCF